MAEGFLLSFQLKNLQLRRTRTAEKWKKLLISTFLAKMMIFHYLFWGRVPILEYANLFNRFLFSLIKSPQIVKFKQKKHGLSSSLGCEGPFCVTESALWSSFCKKMSPPYLGEEDKPCFFCLNLTIWGDLITGNQKWSNKFAYSRIGVVFENL